MNIDSSISFIKYLVYLLEIWAIIMVLYVLVRYMILMFSNAGTSKGTTAVKA